MRPPETIAASALSIRPLSMWTCWGAGAAEANAPKPMATAIAAAAIIRVFICALPSILALS